VCSCRWQLEHRSSHFRTSFLTTAHARLLFSLI
jgi:hypothetical protein